VQCGSLTSPDPRKDLPYTAPHGKPPGDRVYAHRSTAGHELPAPWAAESLLKTVKAPKLLRTYLELSEWICGPPAIEREFRTMDFLTLLDPEQIPARFRAWLRAEG
jgi:hypothetical protein